MKKYDFYKNIVWMSAFCILAAVIIKQVNAFQKERKVYGFELESDNALTAEIKKEFEKLAGILKFEPTDSVAVTLQLGTYTLETNLTGLDLLEYPLEWKTVQSEIKMGNTLALFVGEEIFSSFLDKSGYRPLKSQIEKWTEQYETLELHITDEEGRVRKAKICGILKKPGNKVCMDRKQMKEIFGGNARTTGGFMEIYGYSNMKMARRLLESAGYLCRII